MRALLEAPFVCRTIVAWACSFGSEIEGPALPLLPVVPQAKVGLTLLTGWWPTRHPRPGDLDSHHQHVADELVDSSELRGNRFPDSATKLPNNLR